MIILTDCDGVLLNWKDSFVDWMIKVKRIKPEYPLKRYVEQSFAVDNIEKYIFEFGESKYFANLQPIEGAVDAICSLLELNYRFQIITAVDKTMNIYKNRVENIFKYFPHEAFVGFSCIGSNASKSKILQSYKPTFYIEDSIRHAMEGIETNHISILLNSDYNNMTTDPRIHRFDKWNEIVSFIEKFQAKSN